MHWPHRSAINSALRLQHSNSDISCIEPSELKTPVSDHFHTVSFALSSSDDPVCSDIAPLNYAERVIKRENTSQSWCNRYDICSSFWLLKEEFADGGGDTFTFCLFQPLCSLQSGDSASVPDTTWLISENPFSPMFSWWLCGAGRDKTNSLGQRAAWDKQRTWFLVLLQPRMNYLASMAQHCLSNYKSFHGSLISVNVCTFKGKWGLESFWE